MQELIEKLGIEWQSLLFQVINFLILLFVLKKFVYNPVIKVLDARKDRVKESEQKAQQVDEDLKQAHQTRDSILAKAEADAHATREAAFADAEKIRLQKADETRAEIEGLLHKARVQIQEEKEHALSSVRTEAAALVMLASEKVLRDRLDEAHDKELVERSVKELMK